MDGGEEVALSLVVACGDGAKLFEPGEEVFDQMPCFVEVLIIAAGPLAGALRWGTHLLSRRRDRIDHPFVGVEGFVGDQHVGLHRRDQVVGADEIMCLASGQMEADRIAKGINQGVDLGAQSATRASDGLVLADFFFAPAPC